MATAKNNWDSEIKGDKIMRGHKLEDFTSISVQEFRQVIRKITSRAHQLDAGDMEDAAFYLIDLVKRVDVMDSFEEDECIQELDGAFTAHFPGYYSQFLYEAIAA
jgi:hypothetical protein